MHPALTRREKLHALDVQHMVSLEHRVQQLPRTELQHQQQRCLLERSVT